MSKHSIKIFWIVVASLFVGFLWASIRQLNAGDVSADLKNNASPRMVKKDGTVDSHDAWGNLKTRVNYKEGYKHGISYLFYKDGQVQLAMPYSYGKREGISRKYYASGKIYAETPYQNDQLNGTRILFYRNGKKKAELPYLNNEPGIGLKEYNLSGERISLDSEIRYAIEDQSLKLFAPTDCRESSPEFFIADLVDSQFFNMTDAETIRLATDGAAGYLNMEKFTPSYLKYRDIICRCKTLQGNEWITKTRLDLTSD